MATIWLTSDTHFGHANIIQYCKRPFASVEEMDETLIDRWNAVVRPEHHVYHLGDVSMAESAFLHCVPRLRGKKRLILGNHDDRVPMATLMRHFQKILLWRLFKPVVLTHIPLHPDSFGKAALNVHGHTHEKGSPAGPYRSVCVEMTDYRPVNLDELL